MQTILQLDPQSEQQVWQQVARDLQNDILDYSVVFQEDGITVVLQIDIDPGGGFEGGYAFTRMEAPIKRPTDFKFTIHHQGFLDEVGKFFGMQDVETGYPSFDEKVVVKTNDENGVKRIFEDASLRKTFENLNNYNLHISHHEQAVLKLEIEDAIIDAEQLRSIYHAFVTVLKQVEGVSANG